MADQIKMPDWYMGELYHENDEGEDHAGFAVMTVDPNAPEDEPGEIVCALYTNMGSHIVPFENSERNARLIAAAPQLLASLLQVVQTFKGAAPWMGTEYEEVLANAHAAIRLTLDLDEKVAEIESVMAAASGQLQ